MFKYAKLNLIFASLVRARPKSAALAKPVVSSMSMLNLSHSHIFLSSPAVESHEWFKSSVQLMI